MLFNSLPFLLLFLPIVLGVARLSRGRFLLFWLCGASAIFYAFAGHVWFLVPMAVTTVLDFLIGKKIELAGPRTTRARAFLILSVGANLGLLGYFKYSGLLVGTVEGALHSFHIAEHSLLADSLRVTLPAGISFYTFQTMSYVIDIYRGDAKSEESFAAYLAFVAFFPHLVAGPLTRHNQLIPQLHAIEAKGISGPLWPGAGMFAIGLAKKVLIADRIGSLIDPILADTSHLGFIGGWTIAFGYAMQLYFDFSGYSDMAVGLGRLFQIELPRNFNSPYKSVSPADFWRRWHITLSLWLRDYLYISLGGSRVSAARAQLNLLLTMVLGGLWHGANWTFAIWGFYHGLLLVLHRLVAKRWEALPEPAQRVITFVLVCVGWVFFRAPNLTSAGQWLASMAGLGGIFVGQPYLSRIAIFTVVGAGIAFMLPNSSEIDFPRLTTPRRALLGLTASLAVIMMNYSSKFLYFQF